MSPPLSILVLSRFRPDQSDGGAALRNSQNIHALAQLGTVDVVSITEAPQAGGAPPPVRRWIALDLETMEPNRGAWDRWRSRCWWLRPQVHPAVDRYLLSPLSKALAAHLASHPYDIAVVEELKLAPYLPLLRRHVRCVVFDAHNVESELRLELERSRRARSTFEALKHRHRSRRLFLAERTAVRQAHTIWACSARDAHRLGNLYRPKAPITVVPNGVNPDAYAAVDAVPPGADWRGHPVTVCFAGTYSYPPNGDAAQVLIESILPLLRRSAPDARLRLIGRDPTEPMLHAAARDPGITVTGRVASLLPWLQEPSVVVVPLTVGSGTRLKLLEAFAARRPVVSSAKGAEGLDVIDGEHVLLREAPEAFAAAVLQLWQAPDRRARLCQRAQQLVLQRYSWSVAAAAVARSLRPWVATQPAAATHLP